jgi:hypothetical protein
MAERSEGSMSTCICSGDRASYQKHRREGTLPCPEAIAANAEYARQRRQAKAANAAPKAAWPTRPDTEGLITFLSVAPQAGSQVWNAEVWDLAPDQRRWLRYGTLEAVEPDGGIEFVEKLVNQFDVRVVVMTNDDIAFWLARSPDYSGFIGRMREMVLYHIAETLDPGDPLLGVRAMIERSYRDPAVKILPKSSPGDYIARKLEDIAGGGQHHLRADWLGETALPRVPYAARVAERRREKEAEDPEHPRRVLGATVARGSMGLEGRRYEKPKVALEEIPSDHPALRQESWVGVIQPPKRGRR